MTLFVKGYTPSTKGRGRGITWVRAHIDFKGTECLIWPFGKDDKGYGTLGHNGKIWKASRMMCLMAHGEPPAGRYHAAHSCGRGHEGCVNPRHLSWKTPQENTMDAVRSGRYGYSSAGHVGKLKRAQVSEIKALAGILTNLELGLIYKVHPETIAKIRRGETWKKVA